MYLEDMTERVKDAVAEQDHTNWKKALEHRCEGNNQWRGGYCGLTILRKPMRKLLGEVWVLTLQEQHLTIRSVSDRKP